MKKTHIIFVILFSFVFYYCSESNITNGSFDTGLNFYLLKDSTLSVNRIVGININNLELAEEPFLTYKDLSYYNWSEHSFVIDSNKAIAIRRICENSTIDSGIPFIVTVNQERIYLGAFWFRHSSQVPLVPHIFAIYGAMKNPKVLIIHKSRGNTTPDLRNDQRIYSILKEYNLLIE